YSIVCHTPKFVNSLSRYEKIIYDYRYREVELSTYEWEDITTMLDQEAAKHNKSFSKSTTLRLRNRMLEQYAEKIGYTMMRGDRIGSAINNDDNISSEFGYCIDIVHLTTKRN